MESKLSKIYYSPRGYWKGYSAIQKLSSEANVSMSEAKKWLEKQALWQIYLPKPKHISRPHWTESEPNKIHQADLLFLPHDKVGRKIFKYALVVIDIASRYKDAEPLTSKQSDEVSQAFKKIYSRKLKFPQELIVDPGTEFKGSVTKLFEKNGTLIKRSEAGNHRAQAFVESANKIIGERIFSHQYAQEFWQDRSRVWVKELPQIIKTLNSSVTRLTGEKPIDAYLEKSVKIKTKNYPRDIGFNEERINMYEKVRYLLQPGELEGGSRRATDPIWSIKVYELEKSIVSKDQPILYYLLNGPKRNFVREELLNNSI